MTKTTIELPDRLFRDAKALAAKRGIPLRQYVAEALEGKIGQDKAIAEKPWMKTIGGLSHMHNENVRIQRIIDEEFERIDPEDWD